MNEKILFVDDVPAVLEGYKRLLRGVYTIETAVGPEEGLQVVAARGPYAVVVSDMRMPKMSGAEFLAAVKARSPETVRMTLTGYADIETATNAVNEGNVFRFLTKPCTREALIEALGSALEKYRSVSSERELLDQTLRGCVQAMSEMLSVINPAAYARGRRLQRCVRFIVDQLHIPHHWEYDAAALLSQIGCVTVPPETLVAVNAGKKLSPEEELCFSRHPSVAAEMLACIPRMEPVIAMILQQESANPKLEDGTNEVVTSGSQILRTALQYDRLLASGIGRDVALERLQSGAKHLEFSVASVLGQYRGEEADMTASVCEVADLSAGMIVDEEIRTVTGTLIASRGQELSSALALRVATFAQQGLLHGIVRVKLPKAPAAGGAMVVPQLVRHAEGF